ncbi:MAG: hypothetical protein ACOYOK_04005 [Pseudobdellovibrionaceae bacterium]
MFFKNILATFLACASLVACNAKIGEAPPDSKTQNFDTTQCISTVMPTVTLFVVGTATNDQLKEAWGCYSLAIQKFRKYVRGNEKDKYTSQELASFLEDNFLNNKTAKISSDLQVEFMKFKQIFLGGRREYLTLSELDSLPGLFEQLRDVTLSLNPYMKLLILDWQPAEDGQQQANIQFFDGANIAVQGAAKKLASLIQKNHLGYNLSDFQIFIREMSKFYKEDWALNQSLQRLMPIIQQLKKSIAGGVATTVDPREWRSFLLLGSRGYVQYLRYYYFIKKIPESGSGIHLGYLSRSLEDFFSVFQDLLSEKPGGVISDQELFDLLQSFSVAWPEFIVSEKLVNSFMKIKQMFFGGAINTWSIRDFEKARLKVPQLKLLLEKLLPYINLYELEWDREGMNQDEAQKFFSEAQKNLNSSTQELSDVLESSIAFEDLVTLFDEYCRLYPHDVGDTHALCFADSFKKYRPLMRDIKNILFNENDDVIKKEQWQTVLPVIIESYSSYLYYYYFIKAIDFKDPNDLKNLQFFSDQVLNLIRDFINKNPKNQIAIEDLISIAKRLSELGIIPESVEPKTIESIVRAWVKNVLTPPELRLQGLQNSSLNLNSIEYVRYEVNIYLQTERFIAGLFKKSAVTSFSPKELLLIIDQELQKPTLDSSLQKGLVEFKNILDTPYPMILDEQKRLWIAGYQTYSYNLDSLSQLNLNRWISKVLVQSYSTDLLRLKQNPSLSAEEAETAFADWKDLAINLDLLQPQKTNFISSRFLEANIFTPHSVGDEWLSLTELNDLISMIFSGIKNKSLIENDIKSLCFQNKVLKSNSSLELKCLRSVYYKHAVKHFAALPGFARYMQKVDKADWVFFFSNILKASGYNPSSDQQVKYADATLLPHIIQYIEMVFALFDADKDDAITISEARKAFPVFKEVLKKLSKDQLASGSLKESDLFAVFTYILTYGHPPETTREQLYFKFIWSSSPDRWDKVWADRNLIAQVLGYIADRVNAKP